MPGENIQLAPTDLDAAAPAKTDDKKEAKPAPVANQSGAIHLTQFTVVCIIIFAV